MDKGDNLIKRKVNQAKPYKPTSDWGKMEAMLVADAQAAGAKNNFLRGFLLGVASLAILLLLLWIVIPFDKQEIHVAEPTSVLPLEGASPNSQEGITQGMTESKQASSSQSIVASSPNHSTQTNTSNLHSSTSNPSSIPTHSPNPATASQRLMEGEDKAFATNQFGTYKNTKNLESGLFSPNTNTESAKAVEAVEVSHKEVSRLNVESNFMKIGSLREKEFEIPGEFNPHTSDITPLGPLPILPQVSTRKWKAGVYLTGMVQPFLATSPSSIAPSQNPLIYRWHPSVSVRVSRDVGRHFEVGLGAGSDDAYYYNGYLPAGSYQNASFQSPGGSVGLIVGTNYWAEIFGKWKWRKKNDVLVDPYATFALGLAQSQTDFVEIFGIEGDQLVNAPKGSRLRAKSNLDAFLTNPYLVNNRTYVDVSEQVVTSESLVADYQVANNLSSYVRATYNSLTVGLGTEFHLTSRWDLDVQANLLSRSRTLNLANPLASRTEADFSANSSAIGAPTTLGFIQLSAGLNWKF